MLIKVYSLTVKNLLKFIDALKTLGYVIDEGPHAVLEDNSEVSLFKGYRGGEIEFIIVSHFLTQYYKAVLESPTTDEEFLGKLLELKYSGERWSIPVSPVYIVTFNDALEGFLNSYMDEYPIENGEEIVNKYRTSNPNHHKIIEAAVGRVLDGLSES
ncbi:MAG: hypothetical protein QXW58_03750 [Thermosphaera sp.]